MLSRREFGGGLAAAAAGRRRRSERPAPPPANEPNLARILRTKKLRVGGLAGEQPYFYKKSASHWNGFLVAMAGDLASALGVELNRRVELGRDGWRPAYREDRPRLWSQPHRATRDVRRLFRSAAPRHLCHHRPQELCAKELGRNQRSGIAGRRRYRFDTRRSGQTLGWERSDHRIPNP